MYIVVLLRKSTQYSKNVNNTVKDKINRDKERKIKTGIVIISHVNRYEYLKEKFIYYLHSLHLNLENYSKSGFNFSMKHTL